MRRTEESWRLSGAAGYRSSAERDVLPDVRRRAEVKLAVKVSVISDLVSLVGSTLHDRRPLLRARAEKKEGRERAVLCENVQDPRSCQWIGAVIKCECGNSLPRWQSPQYRAEDRAVSVEGTMRESADYGCPGDKGRQNHTATRERSRTSAYTSRIFAVTADHPYLSALSRPALPSRVRSAGSSSSRERSDASASASPQGNISASRSCFTTSRNPGMSEQTTGVSQAIDSRSVIPKDAFVVGQA